MSASRDEDKDYHHGDLAQAALQAAVAQVETAGAEGLSLRELAASLGVTHRALYRHYADRAALLAAVAAHGFERLAAQAAAATDASEFCRSYLRFAAAHPRLYALMMQGASPRPAALKSGQDRLIQAARALFPHDEAVKRAWILLHGGIALNAAGMLAPREAEALEDFLLSLTLDT